MYLTDGYALRKTRNHTVRFFLQGNETDIARRLAGLLKKAGLNPNITFGESARNDITVRTCSKQLAAALPNKKGLLDDTTLRERYFDERNLSARGEGIAFLAGLLDGDGTCPVKVDRKRSFRGILNKWCWSFVQTRLPFLVDYVAEFMESVVSKSVSVEAPGGSGKRIVYFHKPGIIALLDLGIDDYSIKVARWMEKVARLETDLSAHHTVGQVARMLNVSSGTVLNWIRTGKLASHRRIENRAGNYWHYIAHDEVVRLTQQLVQNKKTIERAKMDGIKILEVAKILGISPRTLRKWSQSGKLQGSLLRDGSYKYYMIPREEVQRLATERHQRGRIEKRKRESENS